MEVAVCFLVGYLVGTFNPSYIIAKMKGFNIKKRGSGNAGGSNALITMGKPIGALCMVIDILKAYVIIKLMWHVFPNFSLCFPITAGACILGHIFPFYMHFEGGKGLACMGGAMMAYSVKAFLIAITIAAFVAFLIDYICVVPITASAILPILYGVAENDAVGGVALGIVGIVIIWKHRENIYRIRNGSELHLSYLWNKEKELQRQKEARAHGENLKEALGSEFMEIADQDMEKGTKA